MEGASQGFSRWGKPNSSRCRRQLLLRAEGEIDVYGREKEAPASSKKQSIQLTKGSLVKNRTWLLVCVSWTKTKWRRDAGESATSVDKGLENAGAGVETLENSVQWGCTLDADSNCAGHRRPLKNCVYPLNPESATAVRNLQRFCLLQAFTTLHYYVYCVVNEPC